MEGFKQALKEHTEDIRQENKELKKQNEELQAQNEKILSYLRRVGRENRDIKRGINKIIKINKGD